ncbi:MAG: Uma2 family endonuclease [Lachnospiraceae bacterium]|nr:Uma2 family endonuclease [Lachnospiraceae bacterium]
MKETENQKEMDKKSLTYEEFLNPPLEDFLREAKAQYSFKRQGEYTLEDYYALPDDQRVELIDGVFFYMLAPYTTHQIAVAEIWRQLAEFVREKGGACRPMLSPVDVQLDCDDKTMVEPDVLVLCDQSKLRKQCIFGAPDLVMEVLSDSTARKDLTVKLDKYMNAGVREYWIVDLKREKVIVHDMTQEGCRTAIYGMDQPVPVQIFDGKCQIRFDEICETVRPILKQP